MIRSVLRAIVISKTIQDAFQTETRSNEKGPKPHRRAARPSCRGTRRERKDQAAAEHRKRQDQAAAELAPNKESAGKPHAKPEYQPFSSEST